MKRARFCALLTVSLVILSITSPYASFTPLTPASGASTWQIYPAWAAVNLLTPGANVDRQAWALLIANAFSQFGISATRQIVPWPTAYSRMLTPDPSVVGKSWADGGFDIGFIGYALTPDTDPYSFFHPYDGHGFFTGGNYYLWNNTENDQLLESIRSEMNSTKRLEYIRQWQELAYDELPSITLFYTKDVVAFKPSFQSTPFSTYYYPLWPSVEQWNDTLGSTNVTVAQIGSFGPGGGEGLVPYLTTSYYDLTVYGPIYGELGGLGMLMRNTSMAMVPYMAYGNYTTAAGGKNWTFWIRPGIHFQNGEELDARDYVYTLRYEMTPTSGSAGSGVYAYITSIICGADFGAGIAAGYGNHSVYWAGEAGTPGAALPYNKYEFHCDEQAAWALTTVDIGGLAIMPASVLVNASTFPDYSTWNPSNAPFMQSTSFNTGASGTYRYYAKNGTFMAARSGPFGAGPYQWADYNTGTGTAHLTKFDGYFRRAALESEGIYRFTDYYVVHIGSVTAAIAALQAGSVQVLDSQYHVEASLDSLNLAWASWVSFDSYGVQEMGFNMRHPIWGTGLGTPLGQSDASQAKAAAYHVRHAIEYLIPKDQIIKNILHNFGSYGITTPVTRGNLGFDASIVPRNYTYPVAMLLAKAEFEAAGYTFVPPPQHGPWYNYGPLIAVVGLAGIIVVGGLYAFRPRRR
ncbi:MAG: ABC transporter substrate-binding protein [Promethearchaeati archaeon SRVP18_Atabeyarchaeia-1]